MVSEERALCLAQRPICTQNPCSRGTRDTLTEDPNFCECSSGDELARDHSDGSSEGHRLRYDGSAACGEVVAARGRHVAEARNNGTSLLSRSTASQIRSETSALPPGESTTTSHSLWGL